MGRIIAIGDIHGCADEFVELLNRIAPRQDDVLIQVGDMINRGPDSSKVLQLIRENNIQSILGNHERRVIHYRTERNHSILKKYDVPTLRQLTPRDWEHIQNLPLYLYNEEIKTTFVHGGFHPLSRLEWHKQPADLVTNIQVIDENGTACKRSSAPNGTPWGDLWTGPPFVVYGHTPRDTVAYHPQALGIDTGCVYGGSLTAVILPQIELIQVDAKEVYARSKTLPQPVTPHKTPPKTRI